MNRRKEGKTSNGRRSENRPTKYRKLIMVKRNIKQVRKQKDLKRKKNHVTD